MKEEEEACSNDEFIEKFCFNERKCQIEINSNYDVEYKPGYPFTSEKYCLNKKCGYGYYKCLLEGYCLKKTFLCDGINNCLIGDDEFNCNKIETFKGLFKCRNEFKFIPNTDLCNENVDCKFGSDEIFCIKNLPRLRKRRKLNKEYCYEKYIYEYICINNDYSNHKKLLHFDGFMKKIEIRNNFLCHFQFSSLNLYYLIIENNKNFGIWKNFYIPNIFYLKLTNNSFEFEKFLNFKNFTILQYLNLSSNFFQSFNFMYKIFCPNLLIFDISITNLKNIHKNLLKNFKNLKEFYLNKIQLNFIEIDSFKSTKNLRKIYFKSTKLPLINISKIISNLKNLNTIYSEFYQICCFFDKNKSKMKLNNSCKPERRVFLTCSTIIPSELQKYYNWFIAIFGIFFNLFSLSYILIEKEKKWFQIFLIKSDLLSCFYTISICIANSFYNENQFLINESNWRKSNFCQFLGVIFSFSSINSTFIILFITIERYESITQPLKLNKLKYKSKFISIIILIISFFLAIFPLFIYKVCFFFF